MIIAVSHTPDPKLAGPRRTQPGQRVPTCRYLDGRGQQADRCTAAPVTDPDLDSLELCAQHLGLAIAAYRRITGTEPTIATADRQATNHDIDKLNLSTHLDPYLAEAHRQYTQENPS